jgi:hypothetical protein
LPSTSTNPLALDSTLSDFPDIRVADESALMRAVLTLIEKTAINKKSLSQFYILREKMLVWCGQELMAGDRQKKTRTWAGWGWKPYVSEPELNIGLLRIYKNNPIPIHDHPGASGVLLVLEGELKIDEFEIEHVVENESIRLANLSRNHQKNLKTSQFSIITPDEGNIHSLSTTSDVCTVLDVLLQPYDESKRTWYLPVNEKISTENIFTVFRLNNQSVLQSSNNSTKTSTSGEK